MTDDASVDDLTALIVESAVIDLDNLGEEGTR